jgi:ribosomal protein L34
MLQPSFTCADTGFRRLYSALAVTNVSECCLSQQPCYRGARDVAPATRWFGFGSTFVHRWVRDFNVPWITTWSSTGAPLSLFPWLNPASLQDGLVLTSHQTYRPKVTKRKRCHGFLERCVSVSLMLRHSSDAVHMQHTCRIATPAGRRTIARRRNKKRRYLTV